jgi:hypothetical protein
MPSSFSPALATWRIEAKRGLPYIATLVPESGIFPAGDYMMACWTGPASFKPGEPYGCAKFHLDAEGLSDRVEIELSETNPSMPRIDLATALAIQFGHAAELAEWADDPDGAEYSAERDNCFNEVAVAATDRGFWDKNALSSAYYIGLDTTNRTSNVMVRVLRSAINDKDRKADKVFSSDKVLVDRVLSLGSQSFFTEADLLAELRDGEGDIDWGGPAANYRANGELWQKITNAYYRIVVYGGTTTGTNRNNNLTTMFINRFEYGSEQTPVTNLTAAAGVVSWRHPNPLGKAYPACEIRVWSDSGCTTLLWDSGVIRAPARDADGYYHYTLPPDAIPPSASTWHVGVSMLDAKFTAPPASGESRTSFTASSPDVQMASAQRVSCPIPVAVSAVDWRAALPPSNLQFAARKIASTNLLAYAPADYRGCPEIYGSAAAGWSIKLSRGLPYVATLQPPSNPLPVGDYILECWEGEGFTPGCRYGCSKFSISNAVAERVEIELSEIDPSMPRIDLASGACDRNAWNCIPYILATNEAQSTTIESLSTIRIFRSAINNEDVIADKVFSSDKVLVGRALYLGGSSFVTEADLWAKLPDGEGDIDWGGPVANYRANGELWQKITNAHYRVEIDGNDVAAFINRFEYGSEQTPVTNLTAAAGVVSWSHPNPLGKAYPACEIRVWSDSGCTTLAWDSGVIRAPARDADGYYHYTLPPDAIPPSGSTWHVGVSMLDAKFTAPPASGETRTSLAST